MEQYKIFPNASSCLAKVQEEYDDLLGLPCEGTTTYAKAPTFIHPTDGRAALIIWDYLASVMPEDELFDVVTPEELAQEGWFQSSENPWQR